MRRFLLDTNIISSLINDRGESRILERLAEAGQDGICTSIIVAAEIRYGVAKKGSTRLADAAGSVLEAIEIMPFEAPADIVYGAIRSSLERRGVMIGPNDLLIAAQCLSRDLTLVTNNTREFERVEGLTIENWLA